MFICELTEADRLVWPTDLSSFYQNDLKTLALKSNSLV